MRGQSVRAEQTQARQRSGLLEKGPKLCARRLDRARQCTVRRQCGQGIKAQVNRGLLQDLALIQGDEQLCQRSCAQSASMHMQTDQLGLNIGEYTLPGLLAAEIDADAQPVLSTTGSPTSSREARVAIGNQPSCVRPPG